MTTEALQLIDRGEVLIPKPDLLAKKLVGFKAIPNLQKAIIMDYDHTMTPEASNSWYVPETVCEGWQGMGDVLRDRNAAGEFPTQQAYWEASLSLLNESGFFGLVDNLSLDHFKSRQDLDEILRLGENAGEFIVYSAGIGEVIQRHMIDLSDRLGVRCPKVISNFQNGKPCFTSSGKKGERLAYEYDNLSNFTHFVLVGDSLSDADMLEGFEHDAENVLRVGLVPQSAPPSELQKFASKFDIILAVGDNFGALKHYLRNVLE